MSSQAILRSECETLTRVSTHPRLWVSQVSAGTLLAVGQFPAETKKMRYFALRY